MKPSAKILLAIRSFWKKYWKTIIIILIIWLGVILINTYLKNIPDEIIVRNTYTPDLPIMETDSIPKKEIQKVNSAIDEYFNFCNNKEYEKAYDLLTQDCKNYLYGNNINRFKEYVDSVFNSKKIYNIQNYSNVGDVYIYNIRILDDIMSTGTTGGYDVYQEKIALIKENDIIRISNQGYIGQRNFENVVGEDENIKTKIISKNMSYTREEYEIEIRNKTDGYILIGNGLSPNEITLKLETQKRQALDLSNNIIMLGPNDVKTYYVLFDKFFDDGKEPEMLSLNLIRLYNGNNDEDTVLNGEDSEKVYSMNIPLK